MYSKLYSSDEINTKIDQIATRIVSSHAETSPLFVALLRGANPFASKLMFAIARQAPDFHPEIDYMMVATYGATHEAGTPEIVTDLAPTTIVTGREAIIIDDVLDLGITSDFVKKVLLSRGASSVKLCVLAQKDVERETDIFADYLGFDAGHKWLVGMGMDDSRSGKEQYRWVDEIGEVEA